MKKLALLGGVLCLAACSEPLTEHNITRFVDNINERGTDAIADDIPGVTMQARIDDGDVLVLMMGNFPSGRMTFDPNAMRRSLRPKICDPSTYGRYIRSGGKVRLEITSNYGEELPAIQFARCA